MVRAITGTKPDDATDRMMGDTYSSMTARVELVRVYGRGLLSALDASVMVKIEERPQSIRDWRKLMEGVVTPAEVEVPRSPKPEREERVSQPLPQATIALMPTVELPESAISGVFLDTPEELPNQPSHRSSAQRIIVGVLVGVCLLVLIPFIAAVLDRDKGNQTGNATPVEEKKATSSLVKNVKIQSAIYEIDLAEYRTDDLPKIVKIAKQIKLETNSGEGVKMLTRGTEVKLLNRDGLELIIETTDGVAKGRVAIETTDLYGVLAQAKFDKDAGKVAGGTTPASPKPPVNPTAPVNPPPVADPTPPVGTPAPATDGPMVASGEGGTGGPDNSAPTPEPADKKLSPDELVALMKKFIAAGTLKEFKAEQVVTWKAGEDESIDGVNYQIGLVTYKAQTIFGEKPVNAKALIKGGEVNRWVFAKSGMEMR